MRETKPYPFIAIALVASIVTLACDGDRPNHGAPCDEGGGCTGGLSCIFAETFPGGYCSETCEDGSCRGGAICAAEIAPPLCLDACADASECREGYQCWRGACRARCDIDPTVCGAEASCVEGACAGACTADPECMTRDGGTGSSGTPCTGDRDCASGICLPPSRGGVCSEACTMPLACAVPFEAACAPVARDGSIATLCVPYDASGRPLGRSCASDDDCATRTCVDGQCTHACEGPSNCLTGHTCTEVAWGGGSFQGCGYLPGSGVEIVELGEHELVAGSIISREFVVATPPDSVSVTLRAQTISGDSLPLAFYDAHDPRDTRVFFLDDVAALIDPPARWIPIDSEESIAMLIPNTTRERLPYVPGAHRFHVGAMPRTDGDDGETRVRVSALIKRAPGGAISAGTLDLDVYLVGIGAGDLRLEGALSRFDALLSQAGIRVGEVAVHEITGADATRYQVIESTEGADSELAGLFRLSAGRSESRLALFLVRSIDTGGATLGIAGGIPGPAGIDGTMHSGVVVAFSEGVVGSGSEGARVAGHIMAHEVGHFLGLFHVTERLGACDGGEMPPSCAPFGGGDVIADTALGDTSNLMNWSIVGAGDNERLSTGQGFVLLRSALVR